MIALHKAASHKERVGLSRPWTPLTSAGDNHLSLSLSHYHFLHHLTALHLQTDKLPSNLQQLVRLLQQGAIASCPRL